MADEIQQFDICIVCALPEEAKAVLNEFSRLCSVKEEDIEEGFSKTPHYKYPYRCMTIKNGKQEDLRVQISWLPEKGSIDAISHIQSVLTEFSPRFVAMTGICAGDKRKVQVGDLIVADYAFFYDIGKVGKDNEGQEVFEPDGKGGYKPLDPIKQYAKMFEEWKADVMRIPRLPSIRQQRDWLLAKLLEEGTSQIPMIPKEELKKKAPAWKSIAEKLQKGQEPDLTSELALRDKASIQRSQYGSDPFPFKDRKQPVAHIAPMGSGSAVPRDDPFDHVRKPARDTVAIDMEGAAFYKMTEHFSIPSLLVKGVCDYADEEKEDSYHTYASRVSAIYILRFIQRYVTSITMPPTNDKTITQWRNPDEAFKDIGVALEEIEHLTFSALPSAFPRLWNIPYAPNPFFTGQEALLMQLADMLKMGLPMALSQPQAISGLGGIGKTQIAVEYAYRHRQSYRAIFWIHADTHEALVSGYVALAGLLNLPEKDERDQTIIVQVVQRWLKTHREWLLILDNADDPSIVSSFLRSPLGGHVLLTTRAHTFGPLAQCVEVETMSQEVGALFLLRRAGLLGLDASLEKVSTSERAIASKIAEELGGLPLALDQAGAYINETKCGLAGYQQVYQQHQMELLKRPVSLSNDYPFSVATTWTLSFKKVKQQSPAAADLLYCCALLHPDAIPEELFTIGSRYLGSRLQRDTRNALAFNDTIKVLLAYSLVHRDSTTTTLSIHRLIQKVLTDTMKQDTRRLWAKRVVLALSNVFPDPNDATLWPRCLRYLSQVQVCFTLMEQYMLTSIEAVHLLDWASVYMLHRALFAIARPLMQYTLTIREQQFGINHLDLITNLNHLADLYFEEGRHMEAEPLYKRALTIREQQLGTDHLDIVQSYNNLAELYRSRGKFMEAKPLLEHALAICEQQLGADHPSVVNCLNNLAILYNQQGKHVEADLLCKRALGLCEKQFGADHPNTARSLCISAVQYLTKGEYAKAEPLLKRVHAICEKQFEGNHLEMALSLNNLAELYRAQEKYPEAGQLYQRALAICEQQFGADHPFTAVSLNNFAGFYNSQGKYSDAEPLYRRALGIREQRFGTDHLDTNQSLNNLGMLYLNQGKYAEAEPKLAHVLAIFKTRYGTDHLFTALSFNNLAGLYYHQGKYAEAEPLYQRALAICKQQLTIDHPYIALLHNNLTVLCDSQEKHAETEPLSQHILIILEQRWGIIARLIAATTWQGSIIRGSIT